MTFWNELSSDVQLLLVLSAFLLPIGLMIGIFTWRDARRREMNPVLWTTIALLTPALVGFILYLFARSSHSHLLCTACGGIVRPSDPSCPSCGAKLKPICSNCGKEVSPDWKTCPVCCSALEESQELIPTALPKNKALWAMLLVLIVVPLFLAYSIGISVFDQPEARYFHTRYTLDLQFNSSVIDPIHLNPEYWYSYTITNAEGTTKVWRDINSCIITKPDGSEETWGVGFGAGTDHTSQEQFDVISESILRQSIYVSGEYTYDDQHRLTKLVRSTSTDHTKKPDYIIEVRYSYDESGKLIRQEAVRIDYVLTPTNQEEQIDESTRRTVTYTYDEAGRLSLAQEYDCTNALTGYTAYSWGFDNTLRIAQSYTADGAKTERNIVEFSSNGQILRQEFYDETNHLIQSAQFNYDPLQALMRPAILFRLALLWLSMLCFAGYVVSTANKETY